MKSRKFLVMSTLLVMAAYSAGIARNEIAPFIGGELKSTTQAPPDTPVSLYGNKEILDRCVVEMFSAKLLVLATRDYERRVVRCRDIAAKIKESFPTYSYVWFVLGLTELHLERDKAAIGAFETSHALNSKELWLARLRLQTLARLKPQLLTEALLVKQNLSDMEVLIYGNRDWELLANFWVRDGLKEPISALVKSLPAQEQQRFVRKLRQNLTSNAES
jgi:hypothetical protein